MRFLLTVKSPDIKDDFHYEQSSLRDRQLLPIEQLFIDINETVADAGFADNVLNPTRRVFPELFTNLVDKDPDVVLLAFVFVAPDVMQQHSMRNNFAGMCGKQTQQIVLFG